ncbi:hypothetical protein AMJ57_03785 [Parcubacteria bacterium SG8_24]|nr:MAG: hypothetical protein AMJ57_03785 [Parcubacteria bacterium SG8_24]
MKMQELREKSDIELDRLLVTLRDRIRDLRFRVAARQLGDVRDIREAKKDVARILTLQKERRETKRG